MYDFPDRLFRIFHRERARYGQDEVAAGQAHPARAESIDGAHPHRGASGPAGAQGPDPARARREQSRARGPRAHPGDRRCPRRRGVHGHGRKVSKDYAERGVDVQDTITRKKRALPPVAPIVTSEVEARLIALACSEPPEGYDRWSVRLPGKHVALVKDIPDLDHSTIGRV